MRSKFVGVGYEICVSEKRWRVLEGQRGEQIETGDENHERLNKWKDEDAK